MAFRESDLYRRLVREPRRYMPHLVGVLALELLSTPLSLLGPVPMQIAVDSIVHHKPVPRFATSFLGSHPADQSLLLGVCLMSLAIVLLGQLRSLGSSVLSAYTGQRLSLDFRARLFRHAQAISLSYHTDRTSTDAMYRIQSDAGAIDSLYIDDAIPAVSAAVMLICMLAVLLRLDFTIGCVALVVSPILYLLTRLSRPMLRQQSRRIKRQESQALGVVQEVLGLLRVVKAFGQADRELHRFVSRTDDCVRARLRLNMVEGSLGLLINMTTAVGVALVTYVGISDVLHHALTLGQFLLVLSYVGDLYSPLKTVSRKTVAVQSHLASLERAYAFLDEPVDVPQKADAQAIERARGQVCFQDVSFQYTPDRHALDGVSFTVRPGQRVGIAGATGAGKSTLANLLLRLYDPTSGAVTLDGVDLRDYRVDDLRSQYTVVFQEPVLFSASIGENIAYGCPDATPEDIAEAARAANVADFVESLPDGYDTAVGERGMALSGGQRQRLALARAFLRNAPIIIMDEPTSSVDVVTEAAILEALERLMEGRTTFLIAHSAAVLERCDVVLTLAEGRLREPAEPRLVLQPA